MRKVLVTLFLAAVFFAGLSTLASGATVRCKGPLYCTTKPVITVHSLPTACRAPGSTFTLPTIKFSSNAGIRRVTVKLGSKVLKSKTFTGLGPLSYKIKGLKVKTAGLKKGAHTITIFVKDRFGKTRTRTLRFTVCSPPQFTG
jgi:hypothetical protein